LRDGDAWLCGEKTNIFFQVTKEYMIKTVTTIILREDKGIMM